MLPSPHRLTRKQDVERVSRSGRPVFGSLLTLRAVPNRLPVTRMTAVAGLKVSKRAVNRNRVKRLLREAFRERLLEIVTGADIVIYAKSTMVGKSYGAVREDLSAALMRARLLRGSRPHHGG